MTFNQGDIVWVSKASFSCKEPIEYWPAKFLKHTNRLDICIVTLFHKDPDEQYLIDTDEIVPFKEYQALDEGSAIWKKAYQTALAEFSAKNANTHDQSFINNADEFVTFVESLLDLGNMEPTKYKNGTVPKMAKDIFTSPQDLKLYFQLRVPQMLCFLIETKKENLSSEILTFLVESEQKISTNILNGIKNRSLNLSNFD